MIFHDKLTWMVTKIDTCWGCCHWSIRGEQGFPWLGYCWGFLVGIPVLLKHCSVCTVPAVIAYRVHVPWDSSQASMERALFKEPVPTMCSYGCYWWGTLHPWVVRACILHYNNHSGYIALCRGPDFWMAFHKIGGLRALTKIPFMCLTASASP